MVAQVHACHWEDRRGAVECRETAMGKATGNSLPLGMNGMILCIPNRERLQNIM